MTNSLLASNPPERSLSLPSTRDQKNQFRGLYSRMKLKQKLNESGLSLLLRGGEDT